MADFDFKNAKKLSYIVNTLLMFFVIGMMGIFAYFGVNYMVWHSIPTLCLYVVYYIMISKNKLESYVWCVYITILVYMCAATVCLGFDYGFHLYCMSLIPIIFFTEYMANKIDTRRPYAMLVSVIIVVCYIFCTGFSVFRGPIYEGNSIAALIFLVINSVSVFGFLITYTSMLVKMVINYQGQLQEMAHMDKLTGLYNRHFMIEHLDNLKSQITDSQWIAMLDIDDFKKINDTYGHNGGDYVLKHVGELLRSICKECTISRWGGEEFLIAAGKSLPDTKVLELLREVIEKEDFNYQNQEIKVTVTIGYAIYDENISLESWIQLADKRLYDGKKNGKNKVVGGE